MVTWFQVHTWNSPCGSEYNQYKLDHWGWNQNLLNAKQGLHGLCFESSEVIRLLLSFFLSFFFLSFFFLSFSDLILLTQRRSRIYCCILPHTMTHTNTQSIKLLWTSDQLVTETSTWQHTTLTWDRHLCPRRDSNPHSQQASGRRPTP